MAPPRPDDDWSDSDDEGIGEVETSVLLGVPDGLVDVDTDVLDAAVSRIGGFPAMLPAREPPFESSHCKVCDKPMELLIQMWCPFENSPMDRALYIWGCARTGCQGKDGSVRAWRGLRYNEKYAAKLERKLEREREKKAAALEKARADAEHKKQMAAPQNNPFSMGGFAAGANSTHMFGMGAQIFGGASVPEIAAPVSETETTTTITKADEPSNDEDDDDVDDASSDSGSSETSLLTAMASTTITESPWRSAPTYPPLYLSTVGEYLPPQPKAKLPKGVQVTELGDEDKKDKDMSWAPETYENSLDLDQVFERFTKRVGYEGEQCVRYDLKGTPLPFASDKIFDLLWPLPYQEPLPVTKAAFKVVPVVRRVYDASSVPPCPVCKSARVFECQLTPNLINVLRPAWMEGSQKMTDMERRKAVERALKGGDDKEAKRGMEWGTCMVFACSKDCCEGKESFVEEVVYVQWGV
ncbi:programmed cell death protein 2 [Crassisporium funariophilum]|nr:programmed cell death protein 2 [Crassisporium funariophilum]